MPLWSFTNDRAKSRAVTAIAWSPRYLDMFAVGYGSFDFLKPTTGGCWGFGEEAVGSLLRSVPCEMAASRLDSWPGSLQAPTQASLPATSLLQAWCRCTA